MRLTSKETEISTSKSSSPNEARRKRKNAESNIEQGMICQISARSGQYVVRDIIFCSVMIINLREFVVRLFLVLQEILALESGVTTPQRKPNHEYSQNLNRVKITQPFVS